MDTINTKENTNNSPSVDVRTPNSSRRASLDCNRGDWLSPQLSTGRLGRKIQIENKRERRYSESDSIWRKSTNEKGQFKEGSLVPKFGDSDVNDPSCGTGFTAVFERAANEKRTGGCAHVSPKPSLTFRSSSKKKQCYWWCYPRKGNSVVDT